MHIAHIPVCNISVIYYLCMCIDPLVLITDAVTCTRWLFDRGTYTSYLV